VVLVCGIDPGADGGLGIVDSDHKLIMAKPMPMLEILVSKRKRRRLDLIEIRALLEFFVRDMDVNLFVIEITMARTMGGGELMEHTGMLRGVLAMLDVRVERVGASEWKRVVKTPMDKILATARAEQIFPDHGHRFRGPRGGKLDGLAEASLLALYGHMAVLRTRR
jgi:hypothetical protein